MADILVGLRVAMIAIYALLIVRLIMYRVTDDATLAKVRRRGWFYMRFGLLCICVAVIAFYSPADIARVAGFLDVNQVILAFAMGSALMIVGGLSKIAGFDVLAGRSERGLVFYGLIPVISITWALLR